MRFADVLTLNALQNVQVVAGISGLDREVRGIHVVDFPNPVPWVRSGQILLTTGYAWPRDATAQRTLVQALSDCQLAGVGLAVPGFFNHMPAAACEIAQRVSLPLFEIPWEDSFGQILEEVYNAILAEQYRVIKRSEEIHRSLTQAAVEATSLQDLISVLGKQIDRAVTFEDPEGHVLAYHTIGTQEDAIRRSTLQQGRSAKEFDGWLDQQGYRQLIWSSIRPLHIPGAPELGIAGRVVCPVRIKHDLVGLVWIIEGSSALSELDMRAAEHAAVVAALHVVHQRSLASVEARLGYTFLDSLLEGRFNQSAQAIERAHVWGFDIEGIYQVGLLVLNVDVPLSHEDFLRREWLAERLRRRLRELDLPALVSMSHNQIPFLLPEHSPATAIWEALAEPDLSIMLSRPYQGAAGIQRGYNEICSLLPHLVPGRLYRYEDFLLPRLLMGDETARDVFLDDLLGRLRAARNGALLVDTLLVWAKCGFRLKQAAQTLCVHPKTISYRLERSEELSGLALDDPDIRFRLQLAAQLLSLVDKENT
jgi:PucR family transcriptional regulator, purine catabolism regulatory protein